jgi:hypothetical protein
MPGFSMPEFRVTTLSRHTGEPSGYLSTPRPLSGDHKSKA